MQTNSVPVSNKIFKILKIIDKYYQMNTVVSFYFKSQLTFIQFSIHFNRVCFITFVEKSNERKFPLKIIKKISENINKVNNESFYT